jgi:hypothetical protein
MCSFWLVEVLARMGDLQEATRLLERLRSLGGPLGLYAEEIDAETQEHLGNFPQGFSHMAFIGAATAIDEELRSRSRPWPPAHDRGGRMRSSRHAPPRRRVVGRDAGPRTDEALPRDGGADDA